MELSKRLLGGTFINQTNSMERKISLGNFSGKNQ
jgi:hypothetical protein